MATDSPTGSARTKEEALQACQDVHRALIRCIEAKTWCLNEDRAFWRCYREQRGQKTLKTKVGAWAFDFFARANEGSSGADPANGGGGDRN